jgi:hypothetical protein
VPGWAGALASYGVTATALACWHDDVLVGGAMLRSIRVPLTNRTITECLQGPLIAQWR